MRLPTTQITTLTLLLHLMLGCCAHHPHAVAEAICGRSHAEHDDALCHDHEDHAACDNKSVELTRQPNIGHSQHEHDRTAGNCQQLRCTFVRSDEPDMSRDQTLCGAVDAVVARNASGSGTHAAGAARIDNGGMDPGHSLRTHLVFSRLLI